MGDLSSKVAVVTGAGSGIGAAVAKKLFFLNARVILIAKSEENVKSVAEGLDSQLIRAWYRICDVTHENMLEEVRDEIVGEMKKIDILVTCAAAPTALGKSEELSFNVWENVINTDLNGVFLCCKVFGREMVRNHSGRIVNLTSFHTVATYPYRIAYNAAKSGVEGITRALAVEWGQYGVTVNAVAPGPIRTPRTAGVLSQSPDVESGMLGRTPNVRIGETEDVASLVAFLASEESKHINGQQIVIDGGWTKSAWWGDYSRE